jgi:hypothetical protein
MGLRCGHIGELHPSAPAPGGGGKSGPHACAPAIERSHEVKLDGDMTLEYPDTALTPRKARKEAGLYVCSKSGVDAEGTILLDYR